MKNQEKPEEIVIRLFLASANERIKHLEASLRYVAEHCDDDPDIGQFALRASENPPTAFPPEEK